MLRKCMKSFIYHAHFIKKLLNRKNVPLYFLLVMKQENKLKSPVFCVVYV